MGAGLSHALQYMEGNFDSHEEEEKLEGYPANVNGTHMIPIVSGPAWYISLWFVRTWDKSTGIISPVTFGPEMDWLFY